MTPLQQANYYASKRAQAERNVKSHITSILQAAVKSIVQQVSMIRLSSNQSLFKQIVATMSANSLADANREIEDYIIAYSKASIQTLADKDTGAVTRLLNGELFGKTFRDRNDAYMRYFANDVANLILACKKLKMSRNETEEALLKYFTDPYSSDIISRANRMGAGIQTPSYGRGVYHSAFQNIVRNAQGTISIAWERQQRNYARRNGAIGFRIHRGSSYPCDICDEQVAYGVHPITDDMPPFHSRCCCIVEFVYKQED